MTRWLMAAAACVFLGGCSTLRGVHAEANRYDDEPGEVFDAGPDAFTERLGDPDEWKNHKEGDRLYMTAIWYCVEGEYREVTWQSRIRNSGTQFWAVVDDVARDCERP